MQQSKLHVKIQSRDYWFKVVDFLQHNWALIDTNEDHSCIVYFFGDTSSVFDRMNFDSHVAAERALSKNGFKRYELDSEAQEFIQKPEPPFQESAHPKGPIYSSGLYWSE